MLIGYSTGALAKGDIAAGVGIARRLKLTAIELSALRLSELSSLLEYVASEDLADFQYVSIHAPTDFSQSSETDVVAALSVVAHSRKWQIVVHPDTIHDFRKWADLGRFASVENMDERKRRGRTVEELGEILTRLPEARLCFDIAHARQVDSSMTEAYRIIRYFGERIGQMHFSEVNIESKHRPMSENAIRAYRHIAHLLPTGAPSIIESPASITTAPIEIERLEVLLTWGERSRAVSKPMNGLLRDTSG
jgi:hypothetical protein